VIAETSDPSAGSSLATRSFRFGSQPTNITFAEMREPGVRGLLDYCADNRCSHSVAIQGDRLARSCAVVPGMFLASHRLCTARFPTLRLFKSTNRFSIECCRLGTGGRATRA
jgi:hypothetical protein